MTRSLLFIALFVALLACLPWAIRRLRQRTPAGALAIGAAPRLVSSLAVGPQQRVVTVEIGPAGGRVQLVLGVTGQSIQCLHKMPAPGDPATSAPPFAAPARRPPAGTPGAPGGTPDA